MAAVPANEKPSLKQERDASVERANTKKLKTEAHALCANQTS